MAVRMRHAGVEQYIEVADISVEHYERSGWEVVDGDQAATGEKTTTAKRRSQTEGES